MRLLSFLTATVLLFASCATISYSPLVNLDVSPATIHKNVQVNKFKDNSDPKHRNNPFLGMSATNEQSMANDLDLELTNAITKDLHTNGVFDNVKRRLEDPDLIISGEIRTFQAQYMLTDYGYISFVTILPILTWYFGVPVNKNLVVLAIDFTVSDANGNLIKKYSKSYYEVDRSSMYKNIFLSLPSTTNKGLGAIVEEFREDLLRDFKE